MKINVGKLSEVSLGTPILSEGIYTGVTKQVEVKENKNGGNSLLVTIGLTGSEVTTHEGKTIKNQDFAVFHRFSLTPTFRDGSDELKYDPRQNLKRLALAVGYSEQQITDKDAEGGFEESDFKGKEVKFKLRYVPAEGGYSEKNEVEKFLKI